MTIKHATHIGYTWDLNLSQLFEIKCNTPNKDKEKGKGHETTPERIENPDTHLDISLMGEDISTIMKAGNSNQAHKENTAKAIQSHIMIKLKNINALKKPKDTPKLAEMEIEDDQPPQPSQ